MSCHDPENFSLLAAAMEAIYQIAKPRVLDRYWGLESPDEGLDGNRLHVWHFDRPDAVQEEIYEECHVVAKELNSFFDTEAFKVFSLHYRVPESQYLSPELLSRDVPLRLRVERHKEMKKFLTHARREKIADRVLKGGK